MTKLHTDYTGKFQMLIPIEWEYKNPSMSNKLGPESFGDYDNMLGAFQISCKEITPHINELINKKELKTLSYEQPLQFVEDYTLAGKFHTYVWSCAIEDHFIFITYIFENKHVRKKNLQKELLDVKSVIESIKFIEPKFREIVLAWRRYHLFMWSMAASIDLRNKALKNGSFIELVVLTANRIDGLLRLALILKNQLDNNNSEMDVNILYQGETDRAIIEHKIYSLALGKKIIRQDLHDELQLLYKDRNKVIHRYIITDIRTEDVVKISERYYQIEDKIDTIINSLEQEQFKLKVGINANVEPGKRMQDENYRRRIFNAVRDKHGRINWDAKND